MSRPATVEDLDARLLGKGLAGLRIFFGIILFANGLAKLFSFRTIEIGPYSSFLINREETRQVLDFEINKRNGGTDVPLLKTIANDVILPNFDVFQWLITAVELGVGAALIVGLASRGAALIGLGSSCSSSSSTCQAGADVRAAARVGPAAHPHARPRGPGLGPRPALRGSRHRGSAAASPSSRRIRHELAVWREPTCAVEIY